MRPPHHVVIALQHRVDELKSRIGNMDRHIERAQNELDAMKVDREWLQKEMDETTAWLANLE